MEVGRAQKHKVKNKILRINFVKSNAQIKQICAGWDDMASEFSGPISSVYIG